MSTTDFRNTPDRKCEHQPSWHLAEAERLLALAAVADEGTEAGNPRRWSYMERAQAHVNLARALAGR